MAASVALHASKICSPKIRNQRITRVFHATSNLTIQSRLRKFSNLGKINGETRSILTMSTPSRAVNTTSCCCRDSRARPSTGPVNQSEYDYDKDGGGQRRYDVDRSDGTPQQKWLMEMRTRMRKLHNLNPVASIGEEWEREKLEDVYYISKSEDIRNNVPCSTKVQDGYHSNQYYPENDFFGIREDVARQSAASPDAPSKVQTNTPVKTSRGNLSKKFKDILQIRKSENDMEKVIDLPYGTMRRDKDNRLKKHGRVIADQRESLSLDDESRLLSDRLLGTNNSYDDIVNKRRAEFVETRNIQRDESRKSDKFNIFDMEYFGSKITTENEQSENTHGPIIHPNNSHNLSGECDDTKEEYVSPTSNFQNEQLSYFDEQYFNLDKTEQNQSEGAAQLQHFSDSSKAKKITDMILNDKTGNEISQSLQSNQNSHQVCSQNVFDDQYFADVMTNEDSQQQKNDLVKSDSFQDQTILEASVRVKKEELEHSLPSHDHGTRFEYANITQMESPEMFSRTPPKDKGSFTERTLSSSKGETESGINSRFDADGHFSTESEENIYVGGTSKQQKRLKKGKDIGEDSDSAYAYAMELRRRKSDKSEDKTTESMKDIKWEGEFDSKGFRKLKNQVRNINDIAEDVVVKILHDSILYETDEFIAIDKPYGLPSHGGPGIHHSVGKLAPLLADRMKINMLSLVHRLDKETTGVMLLAKTDEALLNLRSYFKERRVIKRYWVITKGIPNPREGVIDIPIVETEVGQRYRMKLLPYKTEETSLVIKKQHSDLPRKDAVTNYKVLDSNYSSALVECQPDTGVKHQIRCHLAFGLNTPILGDHKYSHYSKMAPQKLPSEMLQRLKIRQPTVRYVAMHLHAKELVLPQFYDGRNVFISSRLPKHFVQNMKWLKLKPPRGR